MKPNDSYQCQQCYELLYTPTEFLEHVSNHATFANNLNIFYTFDGTLIQASELDEHQIFVPRIKLTPYEEICETAKNFLSGREFKNSESMRKLRPRSTSHNNYSYLAETSPNVESCQKSTRKTSVVTEKPLVENGSAGIEPEANTSKKTFPCHICGKPLSRRSKLRPHLLLHEGVRIRRRPILKKSKEPKEECKLCGKNFLTKSYLQNHLDTHELRAEKDKHKPFECKICKVRFLQRSYLSSHLIKHKQNNPYKCSICGLNTSSRFQLETHFSLHFDELRMSCVTCGQKIARGRMAAHIKRFHPADGSKVKSRNALKVLRVKPTPLAPSLHSILPMKPLLVDATSKIKTEPIETYLIQIPENSDRSYDSPVSNSVSGKNDSTAQATLRDADVAQIIREATSGKPKPYICKHCSATFSRAYLLRNHTRSAHPAEFETENEARDWTHICGTCGFSCSNPRELSTHTKLEHPAKIIWRYKCAHCGTRCKSKMSLKSHIQTFHSGPGKTQKHECKFCHKNYATAKCLKIHESRGYPGWCSGQGKPGVNLTCPHCQRETKSEAALDKHLLLHAPDRVQYVCKLCEQICSFEYSLMRHIRLVHGKK